MWYSSTYPLLLTRNLVLSDCCWAEADWWAVCEKENKKRKKKKTKIKPNQKNKEKERVNKTQREKEKRKKKNNKNRLVSPKRKQIAKTFRPFSFSKRTPPPVCLSFRLTPFSLPKRLLSLSFDSFFFSIDIFFLSRRATHHQESYQRIL